MTIFSLLLQSWDEILLFINDLHNTGVSWGAVIAALILWSKIKRNKRFQDRDIRMEKKNRCHYAEGGCGVCKLDSYRYTSAGSFRKSFSLHWMGTYQLSVLQKDSQITLLGGKRSWKS